MSIEPPSKIQMHNNKRMFLKCESKALEAQKIVKFYDHHKKVRILIPTITLQLGTLPHSISVLFTINTFFKKEIERIPKGTITTLSEMVKYNDYYFVLNLCKPF